MRAPALLLVLLALSGCGALDAEPPGDGVRLVGPPGYGPVLLPAYYETTAAGVALGRRLFNDPLLSGDGSVSCATCHRADLAFSDGLTVSRGVQNRAGLRNAPSLLDVAYRQPLFWDGGSASLEAQVLAPLDAHDEMDARLGDVLARLAAHAEYPALFAEAFGEGPTVRTLTRALAQSLFSGPTAADRAAAGDAAALSAEATRGKTLFEGRAGCVSCHAGARSTAGEFLHNGLTPTDADAGRARVTNDAADAGRFRVPTLRGAARTAPYMHDGRLATLEAVVLHYDRGGDTVPGQDPRVRPLHLSSAERADLAAFLIALTDA